MNPLHKLHSFSAQPDHCCGLQVDVVCTSRIPEFFLITLMTSTGSVLNETRQHQLRQEVADFTISLPPSVDVCSLHVRISAGNSAGMSSPSEAVVVGKLQFITITNY